MRREIEVSSEGEADELWLVSYADLLTLLIGFFVLLLAAAPISRARYEQIAAAMSNEAGAAPLQVLGKQASEWLEAQGLSQQVSVVEDRNGLAFSVTELVLFQSGSADLQPKGKELMSKFASWLQSVPERAVVIEGHTDEVPIHSEQFRSNWELSAHRAIEVLHLLESSGVDKTRMSIRSFADTQPLQGTAATDLRDTHAANRRVVIRAE